MLIFSITDNGICKFLDSDIEEVSNFSPTDTEVANFSPTDKGSFNFFHFVIEEVAKKKSLIIIKRRNNKLQQKTQLKQYPFITDPLSRR